jgi:hypothetical protein
MLVGENRPATHTESSSEEFAFDELPTIEITLPDGDVVDPAPTVTDDPGFAILALEHEQSVPIAWSQGGAYVLRWQFDQGQQDIIIREETWFAAWTDVWSLIRGSRLLNRTASQLSDEAIDRELARITRWVLANHTCIGTYNDLEGADRYAFDEMLAYMVAARLRPGLGRLTTDSDLIERQEGDTRYKFADRKGSTETQEMQWMSDAWAAFRRIGCIADGLPARPNMVGSLYGRGRAAEKAGYIYPATNPLLQYLSHEDRRLMGIGVY